MPPRGISNAQEAVTDATEGLIRRARRSGPQKYILDQVTGKHRLPAAMFEPRLPENRPGAKRTDKYLSVNILSSLQAAGLPRDWKSNTVEIYAAQVRAGDCYALNLWITWEPVVGLPNPTDENPHHGAIHGVVELYYADRQTYEVTITKLAKAAELLPECVFQTRPADNRSAGT